MKLWKTLLVLLPALAASPYLAEAQSDAYGSWVSKTSPFGVDTALVLTDGSIVAQAYGKPTWWRLVPDSHGDYSNGTWTALPDMPAINHTYPYAPYDYCTAVLPDGRLIVTGGEYTYDNSTPVVTTTSETNEGTIWDWKTNTWTIIPPPFNAGSTTTHWSRIGDTSCVVNAQGQFMLNQQNANGRVAIFDPTTNTYGPTLTPAGKLTDNSESGWTLLPDGSIFVTDVSSAAISTSERYLPPYLAGNTNGTWVPAASASSIGRMSFSTEIGPQVLRYDGTVVVFGIQNGANSGKNGYFTPPTTMTGTGSWTALAPFPNTPEAIGVCDGVAALLPNGNVMVSASAGACYQRSGHLFVVTPDNQLVEVIGPPTIYGTTPAASSTTGISSYYARMLVLPNGQLLFNTDGKTIWFYTPTGGPDPSWRPAVTTYSHRMTPGNTYTVGGTQFNGYSLGSTYGDDGEMASNYPVIRFTNQITGRVEYGRTHDHSTMAVRTLSLPVSTQVDIPSDLDPGAANMEVVANGIASLPVVVNTIDLGITASHVGNLTEGQVGAQYIVHVANNGDGDSSGAITVNVSLPGGVQATAMAGSGWTCTVATLSCTTSSATPASGALPDITVTVNIASNAVSPLVTTASMTGGTDNTSGNNSSTDTATLGAAAIQSGSAILVTTASLSKQADGSYQVVITITNNGTGTAQNVQLLSATLGSASGSPAPQSIADVPAGGFGSITVNFPASAGASGAASVERYSGSYTGGTFGASVRVTLP